jgi:hypothetical protein
MSQSLGIVFAFGPGDLALQARSLARSIRNFTDPDAVLAFTTTDELEDVPESIVAELESTCTIETGPSPLGGYPIAIKQAALDRAASVLDTNYLLCLDTDVLVLDNIPVPKCNNELYLKPIDIGGQYYGSQASHSEWESLADTFGMTFPGVTTRSTVDRKPIPPYWNAGMVLTRNNEFPAKWLSLTKELYENHDTGYFTDQVALGLLSTQYEVGEVGEEYNYPLTNRLFVPHSVKILHYNTFYQLARLYDPRVVRRIVKTGIFETLDKDQRTVKLLTRNILKTSRRRVTHLFGY